MLRPFSSSAFRRVARIKLPSSWRTTLVSTSSGPSDAAPSRVVVGCVCAANRPTAATSSAGSLSFVRYASAPPCRPQKRDGASPWLVRTMTGVAAVAASLLSSRRSWWPSITGMSRSVTTTAGGSRSAAAAPSAPSRADETSKPARSRVRTSSVRVVSLSSTTSTRVTASLRSRCVRGACRARPAAGRSSRPPPRGRHAACRTPPTKPRPAPS